MPLQGAAFIALSPFHGLAMAVPEMAESAATFGLGTYALHHLGEVFTESEKGPNTVVSGNISSAHALAFAAQDINVNRSAALGLIIGAIQAAPQASLRLISAVYGLEARLNMTNPSFQAAEERLRGYIGQSNADELKRISKSGEARLFVTLDAQRLREDQHATNAIWQIVDDSKQKPGASALAPLQAERTIAEPILDVQSMRKIDSLYGDLLSGKIAEELGTKGDAEEEKVKKIFRTVSRDAQSVAAQYVPSARTFHTEPQQVENGKLAVELACERLDTVWRETAPPTFKKFWNASNEALRRRYRVFTAQSHALPPTRTPNVPGAGGADDTLREQMMAARINSETSQYSATAARGAASGVG